MAKVTLISGKICSGKSTLEQKLRLTKRAVVLSVDEITLAIFGQFIGEKHDEVVEKTQKYSGYSLYHSADCVFCASAEFV